ncbi:hypothetical protein C5610_05705 [Idiomarina sp. OT37-5b]|uniref:endonuclease/exonuclease/phosphatase family protein n=1 Tax=Idiomarina sp. OT37-5b TaxID=2100422 RepID=UPI000CFA45CB|nr:hypothetical protein [Idiomarina sp. OT37-5b]AVJ55853.1 hypothetical protein C5610_05705 [Idiomarina sp. OT37-5b]
MADTHPTEKGDKAITFACWNTGLSPKGNPKSDVCLFGFEHTIEILIGVYQADFIALCEISEREIEKLNDIFYGTGFKVINGIECVNGKRSKFSQAYIFDSKRVSVERKNSIVKKHNDSHLKVGQQLVLYSEFSATPIDIIASHWPSHMHNKDDTRETCGYALRSELENQEYNFDKSALIVLGDFNNEPFDSSLAEKLLSSRDIELVKKKSHLLYNPFWKELGSCIKTGSAGTYFYKNGSVSKWLSFDQIMVSSSLIRGLDYQLTEIGGVVRDKVLLDEILDRKKPYDHLPIFSVIEAI